MSGSVEGGLRAAKKNKELHGEDFYRELGARGGRVRVPKGFAKNRALARIAGAKGGRKSKRRPKEVIDEQV